MSDDFLDKAFKVLILLACLTMIVLLVYIIAFKEFDEAATTMYVSLLPTGGLTGIFGVYMTWRRIELRQKEHEQRRQDSSNIDSKVS